MGETDSTIRLVGGVVLLELAAIGMLGPWAYLGLFPLVTGILHKCPAYLIFGYETSMAH